MSEIKPSRIWLSAPHMSGLELPYIQEAFDTNWITSLGTNINAFEKQLQEFTQSNAVVALSSGTAALHLALITLNIQPGDLVLCQSLTFAASAFPVQYLGAEPVFIDSEPETWNMDPHLLREALQHYRNKNQKVKAVIIVHLYGMPAKMNELMNVCAEFDVPVIEDAAEALGSTYHTKPCGNLAHLGVLSFNGNKIITTSGGGALVSNHVQLIEQAKFLSTQAKEPFPYYEHHVTGYNYRMSNIIAGVGRGQMEVLPERVAARRTIYQWYKDALQQIEGISFVQEPEGSISNRWLTTILVDEKICKGKNYEYLQVELEKHNIESRPLWKPMHLQPVFAKAASFTNGVSEFLFKRGLCLPSGSALTREEIQHVCHFIKNTLNGE